MDSERLTADIEAVRRLARRLVDGWHDAEDVVQDTCAEAIAHPAPSGVALRVWMRGIVRNIAARRHRSTSRRVAREVEYRSRQPTTTPSTDSVVVRAAEHRRVVDAVLALDEPYRETLLLRYFENLAPRHAAERLGVPVETVRTRTTRALERLRRELVAQRGGDRRASWAALAALVQDGSSRSTVPGVAAAGALVMSGKFAGTLAVLAVAVILWFASRGGSEPPRPKREPETTPVAARVSLPVAKESTPSGTPAIVKRAENEQQRTALLSGEVVDADGNPIDGAEVYVFTEDTLRTSETTPDTVTVDGAFELPPFDEPGAVLRLAAMAEGYGVGYERVRVPLEGESQVEPIRLRLDRLPTIELKILDGDTGEALEGVEVAVRDYVSDVDRIVTTRSDADGIARVPDFAARSSNEALISLRLDGYRPIRRFEYRKPGTVTWEYRDTVYLFRGDGLTVRVVDRSGAPVAGVTVEAFGGASSRFLLEADLRPFIVDRKPLGGGTTDERGEVRLESVVLGESMYLMAIADTGVGMVRVREGEERYEIPLHAACSVEGVVVDAAGNGLEGQGVELQLRRFDSRPRFQPRVRAITGPNGTYRFEQVPFPDVTKPHSLELSKVFGSRDETVIEVRYAEDGFRAEPIVLGAAEAPSDGRIRIVDEEGRGIRSASLGWLGTADDDGVARLRGLDRDGEIVLSATGYQMRFLRTDDLRMLVAGQGRDDEPAVVVLERSDRVRVVQVLTQSGQPLPAFVTVEFEAAPDGVRFGGSTDASGRYRLTGLPDGPYLVTVRAIGREMREESFRLEELDGAVLRVPDPVPTVRSARIEGVVIGVEGGVRSRYDVRLYGDNVLTADLTGVRFRFDEVPPGSYELFVTAEAGGEPGSERRSGATVRQVAIQPGEELQLELRLAPLGTLEGRVLCEGEPTTDPVWFAFRRLGPDGSQVNRPGATSSVYVTEASFAVELVPGTYGVEVSRNANYVVSPKSIEVRAGRTTEQVFEVERIEGR